MLEFTVDRQLAETAVRKGSLSNLRWRDLHMRSPYAIASTIAATAIWFIALPWQMALAVILAISIHESGHVLTAQYFKIRNVKGFCLLPLIGGVAINEGRRTWRQHFWVVLMGPVVGASPLIFLIPLAVMIGDPVWWKVVAFIAYVNAFNLIPLYPLDGGQLLATTLLTHFDKVAVRVVAVTLAVITFMVAWQIDMPVLCFFAGIGTLLSLGIGGRHDPLSPIRIDGHERWRWIVAWIGFFVLLATIAWMAGFDRDKIMVI